MTTPRSRPSALLRGRFEGTGVLPTMVCLRNGAELPEPVWLPVDPQGRFEAPLLSAGDHQVHAWTPGLGTWSAGFRRLAPGSLTEPPSAKNTPELVAIERLLPPGTRTLRVESSGRRSTRTEPFTPLHAELDLAGPPSEGDVLTLELE